MRKNPIKQLLKAGKPAVGTWLSLCSPMVARFLARTGFHWLNVDLEHSPADWETMADIFGVIADAGGTPLARVPAGKHDHIKRVLDNGGYGIVVPMVMDRSEAQRCVASTRFPPFGNRSLGGSLHALNYDASPADYYARANDEILVVLQCEHIDAVDRADEIFSVAGIDAIFVGPNDLRASMRAPDGTDPTTEAFETALRRVLDACRRHQVAAGLHCFSAADVKRRIGEGWQFLAMGSDLALLLAAATRELAELGLEPIGELANY